VIMQHGTDVVAGPPDELARRYWPTATVRVSADDGRCLDRLAGAPGVLAFERADATATLELDDPSRVPDLVRAVVADGGRLTAVEPFTPTLEDLYFAVRRDGPVGAPGGRPAADAAPATGRPARRSRVAELSP
jgi:hypothetical protein